MDARARVVKQLTNLYNLALKLAKKLANRVDKVSGKFVFIGASEMNASKSALLTLRLYSC